MRLPVACLGLSAVLMALLPLGLARADTTPAKCAALVALVQEFTGYEAKAAPQAAVLGWCVMDGAELAADQPDWPNLRAATLRLKGEVEGSTVVAIEVDIAGLRLVAGLGSKQVDEKLQDMFRLQNADLRFRASVNAGTGQIEIRDLDISLSGGTEISLEADLAGTGLSVPEVAAGRLTRLDLIWKADGRLMRQVMELAGSRQGKGLSGAEAIRAARGGLSDLLAALPDAMLEGESRAELAGLLASLPEGRGVLELSFQGDPGIGAADLLLASLSKAPLARETLARLFAGAAVTADWQQGLQP